MEDSPYNSTLGQRLQRRLVKPAGVINTQQLHSHYQATQGTAARLVQKSVLPEQVKFRYGSGVLQPTAIMSRLQRQRTESADGFDGQWRVNPDSYSGTGNTAQTFVQTQPRPFQNSRDNSREIVGKSPTAISQKVTVMTKPLVKETNHNQTTSPVSLTPVSLVEKKPKSPSYTPLRKTTKETGEKGNRGGTQPQLKINRKATLAEVNTLSRHESNSVQAQRDTKSSPKSSPKSSTNPTVTQTQPETSSSSSPPYPEKSGTLRISRKATITAANASNVARVPSKSIQDLPLAQTNSPSSPTTVSRKEDSSDKEDTEDTVIQTKIIPNQPKSGQITSPGDTINNSSPDFPLAKTTRASSPTTVSRKEDNDQTVIQAKIIPNSGKLSSQGDTITQASHSQTISHSNSSPDFPLAKTTSTSSSTTVSRKEDNDQTVIQAKIIPNSGNLTSQGDSINNSSPDFPLAKTTSTSSSSTVSRKEDNDQTVIQAKIIPNSGNLTSQGDSINNSSPDLTLAKTTRASSPSQVSRKEDSSDTVIQAKIIPNLGQITSPGNNINNSSPDFPLAKTTSASSPTTVSRKEDNEETVIQAKIIPNSGNITSQYDTLSKASHSQTRSHSNSSPDLPLAKTTSASSPSQVSRKEDNEDTVIQAKLSPNSGQLISESPTITQASHFPSQVNSNSSPDLPLAKTTSASSPTTVSRKEDNEDTVIQAKIIPNQPKLGQITSQGTTITQASHSQTRSHSNSSPDFPLAKTTSQSYQSTIQAKNKPLIKGIIQSKAAEKNYQPTGIIQKQQENFPVQLSQKASIASNPTVVSTTPSQLSSSSELNRVWLKTTNTIEANTIEASKNLSTTNSHHQKLPLPLAITQIKTNGAIARQTNAVENSTVQAMAGNATTPMSTPETASASGIDLTKVAEQVSRILARKLMVERERRGIGKWH
ncbi:MAG: hypothetical protein F6K10_15625 [Moorea sp. SIO2B7]|nr:hypothetical protein [Moorena sp. SIO2B7]